MSSELRGKAKGMEREKLSLKKMRRVKIQTIHQTACPTSKKEPRKYSHVVRPLLKAGGLSTFYFHLISPPGLGRPSVTFSLLSRSCQSLAWPGRADAAHPSAQQLR